MKLLVFVHDDLRRSADDRGRVQNQPAGHGLMSSLPDFEFVGVGGPIDDPTTTRSGFALFHSDGEESGSTSQREKRLIEICEAAVGVTGDVGWQDPAWTTISAIADSDGVLILGPGPQELHSTDEIYGLAAVVEVARTFGKPIALSGQRISETLAPREVELVELAVRSAVVVGVADRPTLEWALQHGASPSKVRLSPIEIAPTLVPDPDSARETFVVADLRDLEDIDLYVEHIAILAERIVALTGLPTVVLNDELNPTLSGRPGVVLHDGDPSTVTELAERAALVISTRSDHLQGSLRRGVPFIGVGSKALTIVEIDGLLERIGMSEWAVASASVGSDDLVLLVQEAWSRRAEIAAHLAQIVDEDAARVPRWWKEVSAALSGRNTRLSRPSAPQPISLIDRELGSRLAFARDLARRREVKEARTDRVWRERLQGLETIAADVIRAELAVGELHAELLNARSLLREADSELAASHAIAARVTEPAFARALRPPVVPHSDNALNDLLQTRAVRWSRAIRRVSTRSRE